MIAVAQFTCYTIGMDIQFNQSTVTITAFDNAWVIQLSPSASDFVMFATAALIAVSIAVGWIIYDGMKRQRKQRVKPTDP